MDEQAALEQQKQNCIFCKIIKGDVPAKKVYEDDLMLAVLDINPATKGHILVMPKEHHPILPLIPFEHMQHLFKKTHGIIKAMKQALLCKGVSVFIANGAAAGQQSPHFLFHLIPREENDMFSAFDLPVTGSKEENDKAAAAIKERINGMMRAYFSQTGQQGLLHQEEATSPPRGTAAQPSSPPQHTTEEHLDNLIKTINEHDDLKQAIIERPAEVKEAVRTSEKWRKLFASVDIDKLSQNLKAMVAAQRKKQGADLDKIGEVL
ncbi:HIT domain-containing protein [Candidatus Woesearchaeota archaeon]|nr:HIT domain-containing protein [Candidatus Woesearchaeota archaeon]